MAASWISAERHLKQRPGFAQVTLLGQTEQSETMQFTATLFADETTEAWRKKIKTICELREERLQYQNQRIIDATKAAMTEKEEMEKKKAELEAAGVKVSGLSKVN